MESHNNNEIVRRNKIFKNGDYIDDKRDNNVIASYKLWAIKDYNELGVNRMLFYSL